MFNGQAVDSNSLGCIDQTKVSGTRLTIEDDVGVNRAHFCSLWVVLANRQFADLCIPSDKDRSIDLVLPRSNCCEQLSFAPEDQVRG